MYLIRGSKRFKKNFQKLDHQSQRSIEKAIFQLSKNPYPPSLRTKKMRGRHYIFEASATTDLRITFHYDEQHSNTIVLRNCSPHDRTLSNP